jgi:hypothetical protein
VAASRSRSSSTQGATIDAAIALIKQGHGTEADDEAGQHHHHKAAAGNVPCRPRRTGADATRQHCTGTDGQTDLSD